MLRRRVHLKRSNDKSEHRITTCSISMHVSPTIPIQTMMLSSIQIACVYACYLNQREHHHPDRNYGRLMHNYRIEQVVIRCLYHYVATLGPKANSGFPLRNEHQIYNVFKHECYNNTHV